MNEFGDDAMLRNTGQSVGLVGGGLAGQKIGAVLGGILGMPLGPVGSGVGAFIGGGLGTVAGSQLGSDVLGAVFMTPLLVSQRTSVRSEVPRERTSQDESCRRADEGTEPHRRQDRSDG